MILSLKKSAFRHLLSSASPMLQKFLACHLLLVGEDEKGCVIRVRA